MSQIKEPTPKPLERRAVRALMWTERLVFFLIGALLFIAALALLVRSAATLLALITAPNASTISVGSDFLDLILLVLMVVELAYTVVLSLRGSVLVAEPFLLVGLIAVIRRILVITVGEVSGAGTGKAGLNLASEVELGVLTGVVIAFVLSIVILRSRPRTEMIVLEHED